MLRICCPKVMNFRMVDSRNDIEPMQRSAKTARVYNGVECLSRVLDWLLVCV